MTQPAAGGGVSAGVAAAAAAAAATAAAAAAAAVTATSAAVGTGATATGAAATAPPQTVRPPAPPTPPRASAALHFVAGGVGGALGAIATCPLEVTKTRLQSSLYRDKARGAPSAAPGPPVTLARVGAGVQRQFGSAVSTMADIYRTEGLRALWKGLGPNLVGIIPSRAIYFSTYTKAKERLASWHGRSDASVVHMLAAITAGVTVATITCPIWLVKTRMQLQNQTSVATQRYRNSLHCLTEVVRTEGFLALYRGLGASYLGVMEGTIQFVIYEQLKLLRAPPSTHAHQTPDWFEYFLMAAASKLVAAVATYPHEVIRTRMREPSPIGVPKYRTITQTVRTIWREEGAYALYNGMGAHVLRVVPNAAIMFLGYEMIVWAFAPRPPPATQDA